MHVRRRSLCCSIRNYSSIHSNENEGKNSRRSLFDMLNLFIYLHNDYLQPKSYNNNKQDFFEEKTKHSIVII